MFNNEILKGKINNVEYNNRDMKEQNYENIKKLLKSQKINPENKQHLKYLLSISLKEEKKNFDFQYFVSFLLTYKNEDNIDIFYDYFFHCCELGKLNYITLLLNNHLSINSQNELGETPMHIAISKKNINLIKLLMEYNPILTLKTYKDKLSCYDYAEISGEEEIKNILNAKSNPSKDIDLKLKSFINNIDIKLSVSSLESGVKRELLNYCGETYISNSKTDASEIKTINRDKPIKINGIIKSKNDSSQSRKEFSNKKILRKNMNYYNQKKDNLKQVMNKKENKENGNYSNKTIRKQKRIFSNLDREDYRYLSYRKEKYQKKRFIFEESHLKKYNFKISPSVFSLPKKNIELNIIESDYINNKKTKEKNNEEQFNLFFTQINLPKEYTKKFIESGFDNLGSLILITKSNIALSNQNLKDMGITVYGHRAKILIHLEEKAGIFPFSLEKGKIYEVIDDITNKNNSLFKFLASINLDQYIQNFIDNGIYSCELLFTQMLTRQPINERILEEDFNIENPNHRAFLYYNLRNWSKKYEKKLKIQEKNKIEYEGSSLNECEVCTIY